MVKLGDNPTLLPDNTGLTGTRASTAAGRGKLVVTKTYRKPSAHLPQRGLPAPAAFPRDFSTGAQVSPKHRCPRAHGRANSPHLLNRPLGTKAGARSLTGQRACPALAGALPQNCGRKGKEQGLTPAKRPPQHRAGATASCECLDSAPSGLVVPKPGCGCRLRQLLPPCAPWPLWDVCHPLLPTSCRVHPGGTHTCIPSPQETIHTKCRMQLHGAAPFPGALTPSMCVPAHEGTPDQSPSGRTQFPFSRRSLELLC